MPAPRSAGLAQYPCHCHTSGRPDSSGQRPETEAVKLSDEQCLVRDMARDFAASRLAPNAATWDREAHVPREVVTEMGTLGLLGMTVAERWGGAGADFRFLCAGGGGDRGR